MRMISCCSGRADFLQRSGMLLRCVHVLRHITAACPVSGGTVCSMHSGCCPKSDCAIFSSVSCSKPQRGVSAFLNQRCAPAVLSRRRGTMVLRSCSGRLPSLRACPCPPHGLAAGSPRCGRRSRRPSPPLLVPRPSPVTPVTLLSVLGSTVGCERSSLHNLWGNWGPSIVSRPDAAGLSADFLGYPWRPDHLAADGLHLTAYPSQCVGTQRTVLYLEVLDHTLAWGPQKTVVPRKH